MGENKFSQWPVALYGMDLLLAGVAYFILVQSLLSLHGSTSILAAAMGNNFKGKISNILYLAAVPLAFVNTWIACVIFIIVDAMWLIPDPRIEKTLAK